MFRPCTVTVTCVVPPAASVTLGGEKVNWIIYDDGSDTTKAVTNTRKLLAEDKVDVIVGSTITPNSLAMVDQNIFLFEGSVHDNLTLWNPTISRINTIQAANPIN